MFNKAVSLVKLVFSRAPDTSTPQGRSQDRYRRAALTSVTAIAARVVNIGTGLATVPLTLSYLGKERFGLWMVLTSFVGFLTFTDMGLGIGLQNALAECHGKEDRTNPRSYISSALLVMILLFSVLIGIALIVLPHIPLTTLLKTETKAARNDLLPTAQAVLITFGFGLPCGLIQRIYNAYQQGYRANFWLSAGRVLGFVGVLLCIWLKLGLPILAAAVMGAPFFAMVLGSFVLFRRCSSLRPSAHTINWRAMRRIFGTGITAVGAQIGCVLIYSGPALVIANRLGTAAVTPYAVTQKLLGTAGIILTTVVLPLWPAYGEAAARGDWRWVTKTFRRTLFLGVTLQLPIFVAISIFGQLIIRLWAGQEGVPGWTLLMAVNFWYLIAVWNLCSSIVLNGLDHMIGQALYGPSLALIALFIGYLLAPQYGSASVIWSVAWIATAGTGICSAIELWLVLRSRIAACEAGF